MSVDPIFSNVAFLRNKTKLHINLAHDGTSVSAATQVTLRIGVSFKGELSSLDITPGSVSPDAQGPNRLEVLESSTRSSNSPYSVKMYKFLVSCESLA